MTKAQEKKLYRYAAIAGAALGLICPLLPPHYQAACHFLSNVCTGSF